VPVRATSASTVAGARLTPSHGRSDAPTCSRSGTATLGRRSTATALDDAALLAGEEEAARLCGVVSAIALVEIAALDGAAGELFRCGDDGAKRVPVIRVPGQRCCMQHELPAGGAALVVTIEALTPNSYGARALPLPMHATSGAWKRTSPIAVAIICAGGFLNPP
jgi:hypothetical protein